MDATVWIAVMLGCLAAADDLRRRIISNWISLGGIAINLCYQLIRHGWAALLTAVAGAAVGFAVFVVFYLLGGMGGGDVKLMAAFGSLLGPSATLVAALLISGIGAVIAACCFVLNPKRRSIPYAPAIVLGAWLVLLAGR